MSARSLNKVILIGNLTRDPELRYTPAGTAVCTFGLATNRTWTTQSGETKEETEFHRVVAWNKLGELCAQLLTKGRKVYVEGRLATHSWTGQDGRERTTTEIVIEDMILLDSKRTVVAEGESAIGSSQVKDENPVANRADEQSEARVDEENKKVKKHIKKEETESVKTEKEAGKELPKEAVTENITVEDIPF